jgi:hypothetical protein
MLSCLVVSYTQRPSGFKAIIKSIFKTNLPSLTKGKKTGIFKTRKGKKQESLRPGREKNGIFKTWKEKKQESLRPAREKTGIFKSRKGKSRNL